MLLRSVTLSRSIFFLLRISTRAFSSSNAFLATLLPPKNSSLRQCHISQLLVHVRGILEIGDRSSPLRKSVQPRSLRGLRLYISSKFRNVRDRSVRFVQHALFVSPFVGRFCVARATNKWQIVDELRFRKVDRFLINSRVPYCRGSSDSLISRVRSIPRFTLFVLFSRNFDGLLSATINKLRFVARICNLSRCLFDLPYTRSSIIFTLDKFEGLIFFFFYWLLATRGDENSQKRKLAYANRAI